MNARGFPEQSWVASSVAGIGPGSSKSSASPVQEHEVRMKTVNAGDINDGESTSVESIGKHPPVELGTGKRAAAKAACGEAWQIIDCESQEAPLIAYWSDVNTIEQLDAHNHIRSTLFHRENRESSIESSNFSSTTA